MTSKLRMALKTAAKSDFRKHHKAGRFRIAALVFKGGHILSMGTNRDKTDPIINLYRHRLNQFRPIDKLHAEQAALIGVNPKGATMLITRITEKGIPTMARPCKACIESIQQAGIKRIQYTDWTGKIVTEKV